MKKLLVLGSPRSERSKSTELATYLFNKLEGEAQILDLSKEELPFLSEEVIAHTYGYVSYEQLSAEGKKIADIQKKLIAQLKTVDSLVIAAPMWNFGVPAALKAYLDLVIKVNETFTMDSTGFHGQLTNITKGYVVTSKWSQYQGTQMAGWNYLDNHLKTMLGFIWVGITWEYHFEWSTALPADQSGLIFEDLKKKIDAEVK